MLVCSVQSPGGSTPVNYRCGFSARIGSEFPGHPVINQAKMLEGWGTALGPGFEPILIAREPREGALIAIKKDQAFEPLIRSRLGRLAGASGAHPKAV